MARVILCTLNELAEHRSKEFSIDAGDWPLRGFIVRHGGAIAAYVNRCPHAGHPLNMRPDRFLTEDGSLILCNSHGALFEPASGLCVGGPCMGKQLQSLPIRVEQDCVVLDGDAGELARRLA